MARQANENNIGPILNAAKHWINECLIADNSTLTNRSLWTSAILKEIYEAFVGHPDYSTDSFMTKLKRQVKDASPAAKQLSAELLWALLLFPSNMKPGTKRHQIIELWSASGDNLAVTGDCLSDAVLTGIGSGGPGFNNYRPDELEFLIGLAMALKKKSVPERTSIFENYDRFVDWIGSVPMEGSRQFRHMLRFFAFPDRVERISSNNDRVSILDAFGVATRQEMLKWTDEKLDRALFGLRENLSAKYPNAILDFYENPLREHWSGDRKVKTPEGEVSVTVPTDEDGAEEKTVLGTNEKVERESIQVQAKLARIGAAMGFKIWVARADKVRVSTRLEVHERGALIDDLPLNYDKTTVDTIELIDVLWIKGRAIVRAFEVEHTTAVYSGLLRMADLLALQPNMDIRLHIVAPDERREKVFREMKRPVFTLLERGSLSKSCTFLSYESVEALNSLQYLAYTNDSIIAEYEEKAD
jgi:hypothetical protein